jgi:hypothetical protein
VGQSIGTQEPFLEAPISAAVSPLEALDTSLRQIVDLFETTIALIDPVVDESPTNYRTAGMDAWDDAVTELESDIDTFVAFSPPVYSIAAERYESRLRWALISAGISPLGKSDASTIESGDGCWRDWGDSHYWTVVGSFGAYAPAFNNHPYYSSRLADDGSGYFTTREFGFQINVVPECIVQLVEGDEIHMSIGDAAWPATYQVGDVLTLPIIGARDVFLTGGRDGSSVQRWYVSGSDFGPFPPYDFDPDTPVPYESDGGSPPALTFEIVPGGIPFAKGDKWTLYVEGGHWRWRKNGGAWNGPFAIPTAATAVDSGLSATFTPGANPSWVAGDLFSFTALQPWAVSNRQRPPRLPWKWSGATPNCVIDLGATKTIAGAALGFHKIPQGAAITVEGGTSPGVYLWSESIAWRENAIASEFAAAQSARYVRISLTGATGGSIGWLWLGEPLSTERAAELQLRYAWKVNRDNSSPLFDGGVFLGKTVSGDIVWSEAGLTEDDVVELVAMLNWIKSHNDEPIIVVPQVTRPDELMLATVNADEIEIADAFAYQPIATKDRLFSARLPMKGAWQ